MDRASQHFACAELPGSVLCCSLVAWRLGGDRDVRSSQPTSTNRTWAQRNERTSFSECTVCIHGVFFAQKE